MSVIDAPEIYLNSSFPGTIGGLLPCQLEGYNFLKDKEAGVALWSTGVGKSLLATALIKRAKMQDNFDFCLVVAKTHNKVNFQRTFSQFGSLDSIVVEGTTKQRLALYERCIDAPRGTILVLNYEKFRDDFCDVYKKHNKLSIELSLIGKFFFQQDLLILWDEMPTKLKNRGTQLYKSVCKCLYSSAPALKQKRPKSLRQYMLTATPIENNPENFFNTVRLLDPTIYGTIREFEDQFVATYNPFNTWLPDTWRNLDRMGAKAAHIIHKVDKADPEIAAQFPKIIESPIYIDWGEKRALYDKITKLVIDVPEANIFSRILLLQMMCDLPSMLADSGKKREAFESELEALEYGAEGYPTPEGSLVAYEVLQRLTEPLRDDSHPKLLRLRELLLEDHPQEKVVLFSSFNHIFFPGLTHWLDNWGVSYVRYDGTPKQKQAALDAFQDDPSVRVFLSSDQGSDSINLHASRIVISYNMPWKWTTLIQRQNRIHRISSTYESVIFYSLVMADSIEDRKLKIIARKRGYHEGVFEAGATLSKGDLDYILTGD